MKKTDLIKKIINIVGRLITILSLVFVGYAIYKLLKNHDAHIKIENWPLFIFVGLLSAIMIAVGVYIQGTAWKSWLDFFVKKKTDLKEALCVYAKANIGKYLPGNVMHYVERNLFAQKTGAPQASIALSSVFEIGSQVLIAIIIAVITAHDKIFKLLDQLLPQDWRKYSVILCVAGILVMAVVIFVAWHIAAVKIKKLLEGYSIAGVVITLIKAMLLYMSVMIIGGIVMIVLYRYMGGRPDFRQCMLIISGYVIAWVLGFVVPGAPGGIGVREFVLVNVLGPVVGAQLIVTLMVVHRLITIVGDVVAYLVQQFIRDKKTVE